MDPVSLVTWRVPHCDAAGVEAAALPEEHLEELLAEVKLHIGATGVFYLATCQRVVWVLQDAPAPAEELLRAAYKGLWGRDVGEAERFDRFDAFAHLAEVASSLDALVPGEPQVLGQVRGAVRRCDEAGLLGADLRHLFDQVLRTAKEVRSGTALFRGKVSLLPLAEDHVRRALADAAEPGVLVLGTGRTGARAVGLVRRVLPGARVVAVSRDAGRAKVFAERHQAVPATLDDVLDAAPEGLRLVLCAMDAERPVLTADRLRAWASMGPLTVIDLALPRNTERPAPLPPGLEVVQMDDFTSMRQAALARRGAAYEEARRILDDAVDRVRHAYDLRCHASTLHRLARRFDEVAEERWASGELPPAARKWYEQTVRALLHEAVEAVKQRPREEHEV